VLVAALAAALLLTAMAAVAAGRAEARLDRGAGPRVTPGSRYLALGDSVAFGYVESQVLPAPDYRRASSFLGYPEHLGAGLRLKVANASCPGETSASLIDPSAPSNGCENTTPPSPNGAYRTQFPLHVRYRGSQLGYAVRFLRRHPNTRLVSLTIGANDLFLCQKTTTDRCTSPVELQATLARISANVRRILSAIRQRARYRGQIAIVHYYSLDYASTPANLVAAALNEAMDTGAKPFRVVIADGYGELEAAARRSGGHSCQAGLLTQLGGQPGTCGIHPSYAGQVLLAQALLKAIRV
jgi:lysophospholipase L1-like esterase